MGQTSEVPDNPLLAVFNAFWDMLEARTVLTNMIRQGSRVKLHKGDTFKAEVGNTDLPELRVVVDSSVPHLDNTSNSTMLTERWQIQVATGSWDVRVLFDIKFEILRALADWQTHLRAITWKDQKPVHNLSATGVDDVLFEADMSRGIIGWTTVWQCEVGMNFNNSDLISED